MVTQIQGLRAPTRDVLVAHVQSVRFFMRDFAELNLLLRGEETSDRMLEWATYDFLSDFNGTPPFTAFSLNELVAYNMQNFAVRGTVISVLQSLMIIYARNHLPFSDGGLSVNINDKAPIIQSMLGLFQASYEQKLRMIKTSINVGLMLDGGPSGLHSDYAVLYSQGYY